VQRYAKQTQNQTPKAAISDKFFSLSRERNFFPDFFQIIFFKGCEKKSNFSQNIKMKLQRNGINVAFRKTKINYQP
jgi:hypothetical protein